MRRWLRKQRVLLWCNWQRLKRGRLPRLRLQRGLPWNGESCPVARTLGPEAGVSGGSFWWKDKDRNESGYLSITRRCPPYVTELVRTFDRAPRTAYPKLLDVDHLEEWLGRNRYESLDLV